jgi:hypothetical protein
LVRTVRAWWGTSREGVILHLWMLK